jgi:predicted RNase H-like HicB family nuclease
MRTLRIEYELEDDGRVIAAVDELPGCLAYGATREEARREVVALALRVVADRVEHREWEGLSALCFVEVSP